MSHLATAWAWRQDVSNPVRKLILLHVAQSANPDNNNETWHSITTIMAACNCSRGAVHNHMKALCEMGYLTLIVAGKKRHATNRYRLNVGQVSIQDGPCECSSDEPLIEIKRSSGDVKRSSGESKRSSGGHESVREPVKEKVREEKRAAARPTAAERMAVAEAWNRICSPLLPAVTLSLWQESSSSANLAARWSADEDFRNLEFWEAFFEAVSEDELCTGQVKSRDDRKPWKASLHWLMKRENFAKTYERLLSEATA